MSRSEREVLGIKRLLMQQEREAQKIEHAARFTLLMARRSYSPSNKALIAVGCVMACAPVALLGVIVFATWG